MPWRPTSPPTTAAWLVGRCHPARPRSPARRERPDAAAIIADAGTLSWVAYERAATRVAAALVDASIPEGARVGVILPDSGTVHAVFLGAELAGVTVVGIGARAGDREVRHLLGRTGASALVSLERHRDRETASLLPDWKPEGGAPIRHVVVPRLEVDPDGPITVRWHAGHDDSACRWRSRLAASARTTCSS